jgi:ribonuclease HIII
MSTQLTSISAKLKAWRLASASPGAKPPVGEIYKAVFKEDFYRQIWDEPTLLALQEFIKEYPPNQEVYGQQLQFISERTAQVVAINDLFYMALAPKTDDPSRALSQIAQRLKLGQELTLVESNGTLDTIRGLNLQPSKKLEELVRELTRQVPFISASLISCFEAVQARQEVGLVNSLLITEPNRTGMMLPARTLLQPGSGRIETAVATQETFSSAVDRARSALQSRGWLGTNEDIIFSAEITDATYSGSSITLPAAMAMYSSGREWRFDPYTAFTGDINIKDSQWRISHVEGIPEKLTAARRAGIRRVVLPRENQNNVPEDCRALDLVFVDDINEVLSKLVLPQDATTVDTLQQRKVLLVNTYCASKGWQLSAARTIPHGLQFTITPPTDAELTVSLYDSGAHTPKQHPKPEFQELLQQLNSFDSPDIPLQKVQQVFNIKNTTLRQQIKEQFEAIGPSEIKEEPYCDYSFVYENGREKLIVKQYGSGKLQLQGHAGPLYLRALEIIIPRYNLHYPTATLNIADYLSADKSQVTPVQSETAPEMSVGLPHIGTDESGKGDYFGPLVIAGVWIDEALQASLTQLGVRDSKRLSDRQCQELAYKIREMCVGKYNVVEISPDRYNQLYDQLVREKKNLNHLLAWGHARAIESLLSRQHCNQAIADQFGDEKYIESKLMEKGSTLQLLQTPKAERFIAVAAASVLARDHYLSRLNHLSKEARLALPKGASQAVIDAANQLVQQHGAEALRKFAKLHFRTTALVLAKR